MAIGRSFLWHGPGVEETLSSLGCVASFGSGGLGVAAAREVLLFLEHPQMQAGGSVLIGPLEEATPAALDALLKTVEEPPAGVHLHLWAREEGLITPTLRSRCLRCFCSAAPKEPTREALSLLDQAFERVEELSLLLGEKGSVPTVADLALGMLQRTPDATWVSLWRELRELPKEATLLEVFVALSTLWRQRERVI